MGEELERLREGIELAQLAVEPIRRAGRQAERACRRYTSRFTVTFDVVHDDEHEELLGVLAARAQQLLEDDDVDVWGAATSWRPDGPDLDGTD